MSPKISLFRRIVVSTAAVVAEDWDDRGKGEMTEVKRRGRGEKER